MTSSLSFSELKNSWKATMIRVAFNIAAFAWLCVLGFLFDLGSLLVVIFFFSPIAASVILYETVRLLFSSQTTVELHADGIHILRRSKPHHFIPRQTISSIEYHFYWPASCRFRINRTDNPPLGASARCIAFSLAIFFKIRRGGNRC